MSRSALSRFVAPLLPFVVCCLLSCLVFYLSDIYSQKIARLISQNLGPEVTIERAGISPLSGIQVHHVRFHDPSGQTLALGAMRFQYSFAGLWQKKFIFKKIDIYDTTIDIQHNSQTPLFSSLIQFKNKTRQKKDNLFEVEFRKATMCFHQIQINMAQIRDDQDKKTLLLDLCLDSEANKVRCTGEIDFHHSTFFQQNPFFDFLPRRYSRFLVEYEPLGEDLVVNQAKIQNGPYIVSGSGIIHNFNTSPELDIKIHADPFRMENIPSLKPFKPSGGEVAMVGYLAGDLTDVNLRGEWIMPTAELSLENDILQISQFFCQTNYSFKDQVLSLKELRGLIDESLRFTATGDISRFSAPLIKLRAQFKQVPESADDAKDISLVMALQGQWNNGIFGGAADFKYGTINGREYLCTLKNFSLLKNEFTGKKRQLIFKVHGVNLMEKIITAQEKTVLQSFSFDDIDLTVGVVGKRTYIDQMVMSGYGGRIFMNGNFYLSRDLKECSLGITADHLDLKDVKLPYPMYCEISGVLSGSIDIKSKKNTNVKGMMSANHFRLAKLEPLDHVADFIGIDSIKNIEDAEIVVDFDLSPETSVIKQFDLDSTDMLIRSKFNINPKQWLEGEIALSLPRTVLEQSKIFKTLMSIARERNNLIDFGVHISGYLWQMRTELVTSDLRDKLKERVSMGVQKYLEKEANKAMEGTAH